MKKFFYFAFAAVVALANVACGDDDDNNNSNGKVTISKAKMADLAQTLIIDEGTPINGKIVPSKKITEVSVMDGGQLSVTTEDEETGEVEVFVADIEKIDENGDETIIKVNGKTLKGEVKLLDVASSRGGGLQITMNIKVDGETFATGDPVTCAVAVLLQPQGGVLDYLCQKFLVTKMAIELQGDVVQPYKVFNHGKLIEIYNIANKNGANLTEKDKEGFDKVVKYVSVSRYGDILITYDDETCDGGSWNWLNNQADKMNLWLKDKGMGNKFIPEKATVDIEFSGNSCIMTIHAHITGKPEYDASLSFMMDAVK